MRISLRLVALLIPLACTEPTGIRVRTVADQYSLPPSGYAQIRYEVTNLSSHAVLLSRCDDQLNPAVDRWENGRWVSFYSGMCIAVLPMVPLELSPGATYASSKSMNSLWVPEILTTSIPEILAT